MKDGVDAVAPANILMCVFGLPSEPTSKTRVCKRICGFVWEAHFLGSELTIPNFAATRKTRDAWIHG